MRTRGTPWDIDLRDGEQHADRDEHLLGHPEFPCVVARYDTDGRCVAVTPAAVRLLGWDRDEICGRLSVSAVHPEDRIRVEHALDLVLAGHHARELYRVPRADGTWLWVDTRFRPLGDAGGFETWSLDATDLRIAEEVRRQESRERAAADARFEQLLDATADAVLLLDGDGRLMRQSHRAEAALGRGGGAVSDLDGALRRVHADDRALIRHAFGVASLRHGRARIQVRLVDPQGQQRLVAVDLVNVDLEDDTAVLVTARDVTERTRQETALQTHAELLEHIIREAPLTEVFATVVRAVEAALPHLRVAVLVSDPAAPGSVERVVAGAAHSLGALEGSAMPDRAAADIGDLSGEPAEVTALAAAFPDRQRWLDALRAADICAGWALPLTDGEGRAVVLVLSTEASPLPGDELALVSPLVDLAALAVERHRHLRALAHSASHDQLTGLANRAHLLAHLHGALDGERPEEVGLLFIDLDGFKEINDEHGHVVGDAVLVEIARRLRRSVRPGDLVARLGGDEFVVVLHGLDREVGDGVFAERIAAALELPMDVAPTPLALGASIGVARLGPGTDPATALREADHAMYEVKRRRTRPSTRVHARGRRKSERS